MTQFSLKWDAHQNNICSGLGSLQQNGDFVDMTLAADGHHVKVHQLVLSLASPYLKDIITSTQCRHPVIFLNKISYATLCAILEYIYTGEVLIAKENLNELIAAGKELHIKGLQDMDVDISVKSGSHVSQIAGYNEGHQLPSSGHHKLCHTDPDQIPGSRAKMKTQQQNTQAQREEEIIDTNYLSDNVHDDIDEVMDSTDHSTKENVTTSLPVAKDETRVQYTLSNQGAIQMILNRYLYCISYTSTRDRSVKRWRCADNRRARCLAVVFTKGEVVISRRAAHNHPFHDKRILKKIREKCVFSAIVEAEYKLKEKKQSALIQRRTLLDE